MQIYISSLLQCIQRCKGRGDAWSGRAGASGRDACGVEEQRRAHAGEERGEAGGELQRCGGSASATRWICLPQIEAPLVCLRPSVVSWVAGATGEASSGR